MKKISKYLALAMALMMTLAMAVPAKAANYTGIPGTDTKLYKHLVVEKDAEIPAAEFSFTVTAGAAQEGSATNLPVLAGPTPEKVKVNNTAQTGKVTFTAGESATAGAADDGIVDSTDKKYATKEIALDFSGVTFTEPGVYRYLITEAEPTAPIEAVGQKVTTVDVYIQDKDGALEVQGYVAYDGTVTATPKMEADDSAVAPNNGAEAGTKDDKFINKLDTINLTVKKTVQGNQGSKDQYFEFTITIEGAGNGTVLTLDMSGAETDTHTNEATAFAKADMDAANGKDDDTDKEGQQIICGADGRATVKVYLHHGQQAVIKGLPKGASYKVEETNKDVTYKTEGEVTPAETAGTEDETADVKNTRGGVIPTGVIVAAVPGAILAGGALVYLFGKKRREDEK